MQCLATFRKNMYFNGCVNLVYNEPFVLDDKCHCASDNVYNVATDMTIFFASLFYIISKPDLFFDNTPHKTKKQNN